MSHHQQPQQHQGAAGGGYYAVQFEVDPEANFSYHPHASTGLRGLRENGFHEVTHQLPPMSSFAHQSGNSLSPDTYQAYHSSGSSNNEINNLTNLELLTSDNCLLAVAGGDEGSGSHPSNDDSDVYQPFDPTFGLSHSYSDSVCSISANPELVFDPTTFLTSSQPTQESLSLPPPPQPPPSYHTIQSYQTNHSINSSDEGNITDGQQHNEYSLSDVSLVQSSIQPTAGSVRSFFISHGPSTDFSADANRLQSVPDSDDGQTPSLAFTGIQPGLQSAPTPITADIFSALGINDSEAPMTAESLIEHYGCEVVASIAPSPLPLPLQPLSQNHNQTHGNHQHHHHQHQHQHQHQQHHQHHHQPPHYHQTEGYATPTSNSNQHHISGQPNQPTFIVQQSPSISTLQLNKRQQLHHQPSAQHQQHAQQPLAVTLQTTAQPIQVTSVVIQSQAPNISQPVAVDVTNGKQATPHAATTLPAAADSPSAASATIIDPVRELPLKSSKLKSPKTKQALQGNSAKDKSREGTGSSKLGEKSVDANSLVEETKCFKCKLCDYICLQKSGVLNHVLEKHKAMTGKGLTGDGLVQANGSKKPTVNSYVCSKCHKGFPTLQGCRIHMVNEHKFKVDNVWLEQVSHESNSGANGSHFVNGKEEAKRVKNGATLNGAKKGSLEVQSMGQTKLAPKVKGVLPINEGNNSSPGKGKKAKGKQLLVNINLNSRSHPNGMSTKKMVWKKKVKREQGTYICEFKGCSVRLASLENVEYHRKCHRTSGSGFTCIQCGISTEHWASMAGHLWREHRLDLELHKCDHCSYRTYSPSILENIHKRIHFNERNYLCTICNKGFKNQKQLINHRVRHSVKPVPERVHECEVCGRTFSDARPMRIHMNMVHNKLRPFVCSHCGHSAASRSALRTHMRSHTGEKPFQCDHCSYTTSDHNSLRRHKMRHSGERPYKCPFCSYACIQSSTYKQHLRNKHPGQNEGLMFTCQVCGFKTVNQDIYNTHSSEHKERTGSSTASSSPKPCKAKAKARSEGRASSPPSGPEGPESPTISMSLARGILGADALSSHFNGTNGTNTPSSSSSTEV